MHSEQIENYLKNIYKIQSDEGKVSTTSLSKNLNISPASVTEMIKKLAEEGTLVYTPYKGVALTQSGKKLALRIIRKHRLWAGGSTMSPVCNGAVAKVSSGLIPQPFSIRVLNI